MLTAERLRELFRYNPETGEFTRLVTTSWRTQAGQTIKGCPSAKYLAICVDHKLYYSHRLAWLYVHGEWPTAGLDIDHINGDRHDNRLANLRVVSRSRNLINRRKDDRNTSGVTGVCWNKGYKRWEAEIRIDGNRIRLGYFHHLDDAAAARKEAERTYLGELRRAT